MFEVKKCENLRLKPFLCMIWKEKVARHVDFGYLLGAKQACNHIVRNEIRGGVLLDIQICFKWYVCGIKFKVIFSRIHACKKIG